ncbi:hypothetical protein BGK67_34140 [Streptomyces subrutilus]|uniref:NAD-glutamate dehydrogenase N-terminal ACT1 domain-containing protein n=1 Tax=Streptomyces subrutilus TaxID=36818 RepID=A0A1E5P0Y6_9ACTN|nr:NAD-glutamate dehydrogenase domain-containing protein [Streptomyces subrutilus]OEJ22558.1 hypothetical protein BGK67_34140 [Streptomyces subrutilus]
MGEDRRITPVEKNERSYGYTVFEVLTDDMPFLVDSVTNELTRQDRGIHVVIHPQVAVRNDVNGKLLETLHTGLKGGIGGPARPWRMSKVSSYVAQRRATGVIDVYADVTGRTTRGPQAMPTTRTADNKQRPYFEFRCGGLHLTVQRVPVWLITLLSAATGTGAAWWSSR